MQGYKIRKGDLLISPRDNKVAFVTKTTSKYIYYLISGHQARVKKEKVWAAYDAANSADNISVNIEYCTKKNRRRQRRMRTLDLHGLPHRDVDDKIRGFFNFVELPCKVITGKSQEMRSIVEGVVKEYGWYCEVSPHNFGMLIVTEKKL